MRGCSVCCREKARSWRTRLAARLAFCLICMMSAKLGSPGLKRSSRRSQKPIIAVSRLLKSCATPPASWPTACIFCDCANWISRFFCSVVSMKCRMRPFAADSAANGLILHFIDTTEQKNLEIQFAQSQKMQAVGQLAGGVAHDFNNLLTAMIGFCDLLLLRFRPGDPSFADIMQIKQNANRAANLVRQLLAFSRQQTLQPRILNITDVLAELSHLLRRLIGENIELKMVHGRDLGLVKVDQGQLEQVIINLVVNGRDAMLSGGALTIRTSNVKNAFPLRRGHEVMPAGDYVLVEVTDSGIGIPKENLERIFKPFFSTKEIGSGTGLGLSTVYGIVRSEEHTSELQSLRH